MIAVQERECQLKLAFVFRSSVFSCIFKLSVFQSNEFEFFIIEVNRLLLSIVIEDSSFAHGFILDSLKRVWEVKTLLKKWNAQII